MNTSIAARPEDVGISASRIARVSDWMRLQVDKKRSAGMVTMVARRGQPVFLEAYGQADISRNAPMARDTIFRIHGTNQPWTIGLNMSSGCIRMMNKDVEHLYERASVGTKVIVIGPGNRHGKVRFEDKGTDILRTVFGG